MEMRGVFAFTVGRLAGRVVGMRIIVTAGPTREYIDDVRFISNASSGRMGYAVAAAAAGAGHEVTLLAGPVALADPPGCEVVRFVSVDELQAVLVERFGQCDALVMTAAVGDFRPERRVAGKIPRAAGPVDVRLLPTEDVLAAVTAARRAGQVIVAFAVESLPEPQAQAKARAEMQSKGADFVVVNGPEAMEVSQSRACVLGPEGVALQWAARGKDELARRIVRLIEEATQ